MSKLKFRVVHSSSEDSGYPSSELNAHNPSTKGWQSMKFCPFPQELGFQLVNGDCKLSQVQILSHQSKIATKVEIFLGLGNDYHSATFKRLGYLSLDSNERSSYQARELKTVYIDQAGRFIKLLVHKNYVNKQNMYCQVGIVAVNLLGSDDDYSPGKLQSQISDDYRSNPPPRNIVNNPLNDLSVHMNLDPSTAEKLRLLSTAKAKAVATEDYITAKKIKLVEGELKSLGSQLAKLDMAKREAVADEDYDRAKEIKDEVDALRSDIEEKIVSIHIPGVTDASPFLRLQRPKNQFSPESRRASNASDFHRNSEKNHTDSNLELRTIPMNIDDMPVGKGIGAGNANNSQHSRFDDNNSVDSKFASSATNSKKKSTPRGGGGGRGDYDDEIGSPAPHGQDSEVPYSRQDDRDISRNQGGLAKARAQRQKNSEGYGEDFGSGGDTHTREEDDGEALQNHFPDGEHPLEGVPNLSELSAPEALKGKSREFSEQHGITRLLGEYRARCLFSKTWVLRDAATLKVQLMLSDEFEKEGISSCLPSLAAIVRTGVDDKIQQVMFSAITLLEAILTATRRAKLNRSIVAPLMDPVIVILIEKLSDGNVRIRDGARKGLEVLAASSNIGPGVVGGHGLKTLTSKQASLWRPLSARLQLLADLVATYGVGSSGSSLSTEAVMNFAKAAGAFTHSNAEVRDSAKELTVAVHSVVGPGPIDSYLKSLRKMQLDEYHAAFDAAGGYGNGNNVNIPQRKQSESSVSVPPNKGKQSQGQGGQGQGGGQNGAATSSTAKNGPQNGHGSEDEEEVPDFTHCMFCGDEDSKWNEDALDLHYWKDCALLAPCPACAQVVEVAGMPEHLLDECDHKDSYVLCDVTGLAIRDSEMSVWTKSKKCVAAADSCMYCPLCLVSVEDTNEAWKEHLICNCPENKRGSSRK